MRHSDFIRIVEDNPIIAAVKDDEGLEECLRSDIGVVFILYGSIGSIIDIVKKIKRAGKLALVHMDLVSGMQAKDVSVDYIRNYTEADGIITRTVYPEVPPRVEYALSPLGESMRPILMSMQSWGAAYKAQLSKEC